MREDSQYARCQDAMKHKSGCKGSTTNSLATRMNFANETRKKNETSWNVIRDDRVNPPIHTGYFHFGGATTMNFIVDGDNAVGSFVMCSTTP